MNNRYLITLFLFLICVSISFGSAEITRYAPEEVEMGEILRINIEICANFDFENFDVVEFTPVGWDIIDWDVENYNRDSVLFERMGAREYENKRRNHFHWQFLDELKEGDTIILSYEIMARDRGNMEFLTLFIYKDGIIDDASSLTVIRTEIFLEEEIDYELYIFYISIILFVILLLITGYYGYKKLKKIDFKIKKSKDKKIIKTKDSESDKKSIEDLRRIIKYGLQKGYRIGELVKALKSDGVETEIIEKLIEKDELTESDEKEVKVFPEDELINEIKDYLDKLSKEEKEKIHKELNKK